MTRGSVDSAHQRFYETVPTAFGTVAIVWWATETGPRVRHIFLSQAGLPAVDAVRSRYPDVERLASPEITGLVASIQRFLEGEAVVFDLKMIGLEVCGPFQRRVLLAEYGIPRGRVSTYGRIAKHLGLPGAGRAAGRALAANPFPIVIPCHRAVRSDGALGGYQGGATMKRALLSMEGVEFTPRGAVAMRHLHY